MLKIVSIQYFYDKFNKYCNLTFLLTKMIMVFLLLCHNTKQEAIGGSFECNTSTSRYCTLCFKDGKNELSPFWRDLEAE